jgi:hypothetical protein
MPKVVWLSEVLKKSQKHKIEKQAAHELNVLTAGHAASDGSWP